jgi:thymidylate synthase ThyX
MSGFEYVTPEGMADDLPAQNYYNQTMREINAGYQSLVQIGVPPQDARGVLPTNVSTNIIFKANLRTLNGMCAERLCVKAQGEFQNVMRAIRDEVIKVHSWAEPALRVHCAQHGTCAFPTFTGCPIKPGVFNPETGMRHDEEKFYSMHDESGEGYDVLPMTKEEIQAKWLITRAEAQPGIVNKKEGK